MTTSKIKISVIIPTLNEEENIGSLLHYLHQLDSTLEIIVADANSADDTVKIAKKYANVIQAPRGRGAQMNAGAKLAAGDILWFLHADVTPHPHSINAVKKLFLNERIVGGAFEYNLDEVGWFFRTVEVMSNLKNHLLNTFYGDMGIFVRRNVFQKIGGYKEIPLMEDMDFCSRLKKEGDVIILPYRINTSARRWIEEGKAKNLFRNWLLQIGYKLGFSPDTLAQWYEFK